MTDFKGLIAKVAGGKALTRAEAEAAFDVMMSGEATPSQMGGFIMALAHQSLPVHGVQFHPESIASEHGHLMLRNFLDIAAAWNAATRGRPGDVRASRRVL